MRFAHLGWLKMEVFWKYIQHQTHHIKNQQRKRILFLSTMREKDCSVQFLLRRNIGNFMIEDLQKKALPDINVSQQEMLPLSFNFSRLCRNLISWKIHPQFYPHQSLSIIKTLLLKNFVRELLKSRTLWNVYNSFYLS